MKGVSTVIATILMLMITIALAGVAYIYISGVMKGTAEKQIKVVDVTCTNNTDTGKAQYIVSIRNLDPRLTITSTELTFFVDGKLISSDAVSMNDIPPGGYAQATVNTTDDFSIGAGHRVKVVGPANSEEQPAYCY